MKKLILLAIIIFTLTIDTTAQNVTWDEFAERFFPDGEDGEDSGQGLYDDLLEMHQNPININLADRSDLLRLPFINEEQADSILSLIQRSGGMYSLGELYFVKNLNHNQIVFMPLFFYCKRIYNPDKHQDNSHNTLYYDENEKKLKTELSSTLGIPLYKREGFKKHDPEVLNKNPNKQYLGNNLSTTLRYRSSINNRLFWGLTAQKDEGEPFASKDNALYDSYSFYLSGKGHNAIKQWIVGDYKAHFGLGLTIGSSAPDAMNVLSAYNPHGQGFTAHTSTDETLFLRGGALSATFGKINIHTYASWRQLDATLSKDSISTIITNGYHRTPLEMSKRNNIDALQAGVAASLNLSQWSVSLQATHTHYDTPYITPTALYRKYYFHGKDFGNYSIYYNYRHNQLKLWGETATSLQGGIATQHRLLYSTSYKMKIVALHRFYSTHYLSTSTQSYKSGSRVQNEHGLLLGLNTYLRPELHLYIYGDYAHYPFTTYSSRQASNAFTTSMQLEYTCSNNCSILLRYKFRQRPQDNKQHTSDHKQQHSVKAQARYVIGIFTMTTAADLTLLSQPDKDNSSGWMLSHKATCKPSKTMRLNIAAAWFHTDSYSEALRFYEPSLIYSTGSATCYYHGVRSSLSAVKKTGPLELALKYCVTHYTNRSSVGTDLRAYNGSTLQDIVVQGIVKF